MNNPNNWYNNPRPMQPMPMQPQSQNYMLTPIACVGKLTIIELTNGVTFGMIVDSADPFGMTIGRVPPTMANTAFPSNLVKSSFCI